MAQYIPKAAVLAEIERRLEVLANTSAGDNKEFAAIIGAQHYELINLAQYINNLEVKEVDIDKEIDIEDAVHGTVDYPFIGHDFPNIYPNYKELKKYCDRKVIKDNDKVKLIIIKDM